MLFNIEIFVENSKECQEKVSAKEAKPREQHIKQERENRAQYKAKVVEKFKGMPGLTDQARNVVLKFWDYAEKARNIMDDIQLRKGIGAVRAIFSRQADRQLRIKMSQYQSTKMSASDISAKMIDIAKVGKDFYELVHKYAKEIGVPVSEDAPAPEASKTKASSD